jgi:eukaryotic-like serine/threonine-protein kinase
MVYKARDTTLGRLVALKVLHPHLSNDPKFVQRFRQEASTAACLNHPHIATVYEVREEDGQHCLAMVYLPGQTLDRRMAEGPLPLAHVVSIVAQLASALDAIHAQGWVHRDVKPGNVIVDDAGQATLLDFGIVRAAEGTRLTTTMAVLGTPEYMSPEQAEGEDLDHRSDLYALGVLAYQMCTGQVPFSAPSPLTVLRLQADKAPPAPRGLNPQLSAEVEQVLLKALAKAREERYQRAGELAQALREAVEGEAQSLLPDVRRPTLPGWAWAAGGVGMLVLLFLGVWGLGGFFASPAPTNTPLPTFTVAPTRNPTSTGTPTDTPRPMATSTHTPTPTPTPVPTDTPLLTLTPNWEPGHPLTRERDGAVMVYVPGGTFQMGSTAGDSDEQPVHAVTLDGFWIDQYEVTNAQYAAFMNAQGNQIEGGETWLVESDLCLIEREGDTFQPKAGYNQHPVILVSWYGAKAYCEWVGARLPTEAEWEYAARGPEGNVYPWGDDPPTCEWAQFNECEGRTIAVGGLPAGASWCGVHDMAGNVWEWVADWYGKYPSQAQTNPTGPETGDARVLRGGGWSTLSYGVRSADRSDDYPPVGSPSAVLGVGVRPRLLSLNRFWVLASECWFLATDFWGSGGFAPSRA